MSSFVWVVSVTASLFSYIENFGPLPERKGCTVLYNMLLVSSSYTLSARMRGEGRGADFKAETRSESYLREGPHSLIDANTFPGRHATCSGCQISLSSRGIEAFDTFFERVLFLMRLQNVFFPLLLLIETHYIWAAYKPIYTTLIYGGRIWAVCRSKPTVSRPAGFIWSQQDSHDVWSTSLPFSLPRHTLTALSSMTPLSLPYLPLWAHIGGQIFTENCIRYHFTPQYILNHSKLYFICWIGQSLWGCSWLMVCKVMGVMRGCTRIMSYKQPETFSICIVYPSQVLTYERACFCLYVTSHEIFSHRNHCNHMYFRHMCSSDSVQMCSLSHHSDWLRFCP